MLKDDKVISFQNLVILRNFLSFSKTDLAINTCDSHSAAFLCLLMFTVFMLRLAINFLIKVTEKK